MGIESAALPNLEAQIEALQRDPRSEEAAEGVRRAAREAGDFASELDAFEARGLALAKLGDPEGAISSWLEAALLAEEELNQLERAAALYERVLELEPDHRRSLFALGLVLHDLHRWDDLIELYRRRLSRSSDEGEQTTLQQYIAELLAEKKDDPNGAFEALAAAVARAPGNLRVIGRLEDLGERTGRLEEVAVAIGDVLMHQEDPRLRAALSLRLGEMYLGPLDDPVRALAHLRSALADDGGNPEVLHELQDVFSERARFDEMAQLIEEVVQDRRVGPHRVRLERELAHIYETQLDDPPRALRALTRALDVLVDDRELIDEVMRVGLMGGELTTVAACYERVAERTDNALLQTYLWLKLGHLYANVLDRPAAARRAYMSILEHDPEHAEACRRIEKLDARVGRSKPAPPAEPDPFEERTRHLDDEDVEDSKPEPEPEPELRAVDDDEVDELDDVGEAVDEALALVAQVERFRSAQLGEPNAHPRRDEIVAGLEDEDEISGARVIHLEPKRAPYAPGVPPGLSSARLAGTLAEVLPLAPTSSDLARTEDPVQTVAAPAPTVEPEEGAADEVLPPASISSPLAEDLDVGVVDAIAELVALESERTTGATPADAPAPPRPSVPDSVELAIDEALEDALGIEAAEAEELAIATGEIELDVASSEHLEVDAPTSTSTARPLAPRVQMLEALEASIGALEGPERVSRRLEVARGYLEAGLDERAEALLRAGLVETATAPGLLQALAELLARAERWQEWLEVAGRRAERLEAPARQALLLRMLEVSSELGDLGFAWELGERAAAESPRDPAPLEAMEAVARRAEDASALLAVLERRWALEPDRPGSRRALAEALREVGRPGEAVELLEPLADSDARAARLCAEIRLDLADVGAAERALEQIAARGAAADRAWALTRLAELASFDPARVDEVWSHIEAALALAPKALDALEIGARVAEARGDPAQASLLTERAAEVETEPLARAAWLRQAAWLADEGVGDGGRAARLYEKALAEDPDDPETEARLGALRLERGELEAARSAFRGAAAASRDEERAAELFERAAAVAERANDPRAALDDALSALARNPSRRSTLLLIGRLAEQLGDVRRAHDVSASLLLHHESALSEEQLADAFERMARGKLEAGDPEAALRQARRAEAVRPDHAVAIILAAEALERLDRTDEAADQLRRWAAVCSAAERPGALLRAAQLIGSNTAAERARKIACLEEAAVEAPESVPVLLALAEARAAIADAKGEADALEKAALQHTRTDAAVFFARAAEAVYAEDPERAERCYRTALGRDPGYVEAVEPLETLLAARGMHVERVEMLERAAEHAKSEADRDRWRGRASRLAESRLREASTAMRLAPDEDPVRAADLLFRRALDEEECVEPAVRAWTERALAEPGDRLAFARLAELHSRARRRTAARFVLEASSLAHRAGPPEGAPALEAPSSLNPPEPDALRSTWWQPVAGAVVEALRTELPGLPPKKRDALGSAALGVRLHRPLEEAARALGAELPLVFAGPEEQSAPIEAGWGPTGPCVFVSARAAQGSEEPALRFYAGRALALLDPTALVPVTFPVFALRGLAVGLTDEIPAPADTFSTKQIKRWARSLERAAPGPAFSNARARAAAWLSDPHRLSLVELSEASARWADGVGMLVCGSPGLAADLSTAPGSLERARLLRFALGALGAWTPA